MKDFITVLEKKEQLTEAVWRMGFRIQNDTIEFQSGQYVLLKVNDAYRQYSICYPAKKTDYFELVVEIIPNGLASTYFMQKQIGEQLFFKGPAGIFTLHDSSRNKVFLVTGTGIAPVYSMLTTVFKGTEKLLMDELMGQGSISYTLFFGLQYAKDVYLFEELKNIAENNPEVNIKICLSREESFNELDPLYFVKGRVNDPVKEFLEGKNLEEFEFYICGGNIVVDSLKEFLLNLGVQHENIYSEMFNQLKPSK